MVGRKNPRNDICRIYARTGRCRFGANCKFQHEQPDNKPVEATKQDALTAPVTEEVFIPFILSSSSVSTSSNDEPFNPPTAFEQVAKDKGTQKPRRRVQKNNNRDGHQERQFDAWVEMLSSYVRAADEDEDEQPAPLDAEGLGHFWQTSRAIVEGSTAGLRQQVMLKLAEDGALSSRVRETMGWAARPRKALSFASIEELRMLLLPFLKTVGNEEVLQGGLLEREVQVVFRFLCADSKVVPLLERAVEGLRMVTEAGIAPDTRVGALKVTLAVMDRLMDVDVEKQLQKEKLRPLVDALGKILAAYTQGDITDAEAIHTQQLLASVQNRLVHDSPVATLAIKDVKRESHLPGHLCSLGPRHDNDHVDICHITILPTFAEITATRPDYLPTKDVLHSHLHGREALLDRHFRLLREDTVGPLRDALKRQLPCTQNITDDVARSFVYADARVHALRFNQQTGFIAQVRFIHPPGLRQATPRAREASYAAARRLMPDTLVCLLDPKGESTLFGFVAGFGGRAMDEAATSDYRPARGLFELRDRGAVDINLLRFDEEHVRQLVEAYASQPQPNLRLVEFPDMLLPAFEPTLRALQRMRERADLPMVELLAPEKPVRIKEGNLTHVPPPMYALRKDFQFNLKHITSDNEDLFINPQQPITAAVIAEVRRRTPLDDMQAVALLDALTRRLTLIQGPPGTGKSYTAVSLIHVLLGNRAAVDLGPILCVCYTNHALDQLLEHLVRARVTGIVRIGGRSKSAALEPVNLRILTQHAARTPLEREALKDAPGAVGRVEQDVLRALAWVRADERAVREYLMEYHPQQHRQLYGGGGADVMRRWLAGAGNASANRPLQMLKTADVREMSKTERGRLHAFWTSQMRDEGTTKLLDALAGYEEVIARRQDARKEADLRCLQAATVIGITTTGLARNLDLLRRVRTKVLLCEEAGEVLEAHALTALLPSCEHAILIGDHLQLRPQVNRYGLSGESRDGARFSLDVSLFERLIAGEKNDGVRLPFTTLETQRRMHPRIARLVRETLYPRLKDAPEVSEYPEVAGMRHRLFWFDHEHPEDGGGQKAAHSTSHTNAFEAEMVATLVSHLVKQGVYGPEDIAVLTPYLGQLQMLRRRLGTQFAVAVSERDRAELQRSGCADASAPPPLLRALRAATVDNFQGEEAKVVIVSLVRSNRARRPGFLGTPNRINVLLSRAQHSMYLLGDSRTYAGVPMWASVLHILRQANRVGPHLELACSRHPTTHMLLRSPDDLAALAPEGGCTAPCTAALPCGHPCRDHACHPPARHAAVYCPAPCERTPFLGCNHVCPRRCGDPCPLYCMQPVAVDSSSSVQLPCGHPPPASLPCHEAKHPELVRCVHLAPKVVPGCGHAVEVPCHAELSLESFSCPARCGRVMHCRVEGHCCERACGECRDAVLTDEAWEMGWGRCGGCWRCGEVERV